jgi:hypothetical protein
MLEDQVIQFLTGLNDQFNVVKTQILVLDPLPTINKVYSLVIQEESNNSSLILIDEPVSAINASNAFPSSNKSQWRGRGYSSGPKPPRHCTFCGRNNHTIDYCYAKHGYPNAQKQTPSINASSSNEQIEAPPGSCTDASSSNVSISQEKYDQLLSLLQQVNLLPSSSTPSASTNQINATPVSGISSIFSCSIFSKHD